MRNDSMIRIAVCSFVLVACMVLTGTVPVALAQCGGAARQNPQNDASKQNAQGSAASSCNMGSMGQGGNSSGDMAAMNACPCAKMLMALMGSKGSSMGDMSGMNMNMTPADATVTNAKSASKTSKASQSKRRSTQANKKKP